MLWENEIQTYSIFAHLIKSVLNWRNKMKQPNISKKSLNQKMRTDFMCCNIFLWNLKRENSSYSCTFSIFWERKIMKRNAWKSSIKKANENSKNEFCFKVLHRRWRVQRKTRETVKISNLCLCMVHLSSEAQGNFQLLSF